MSLEMLKWKNVEWSQVDTNGSGKIDENEAADAKTKFGITIWNDMDCAAFNHEKSLNCYIGKCAIGNFRGTRSHSFKDLEAKIIEYGKEIEILESQDSNYQGEVAESTLSYAKPKNTKFLGNKSNNANSDRIKNLKQLIISYASRIFGAYSMA